MNTFINFLLLCFSVIIAVAVIYIFEPQGTILRQVVFLGTIVVVDVLLMWLRYELF